MWPIFIINLDRAQDRMSTIRHLMDRHQLAYTRIAARDWQTLDEAEVTELVASPRPRFSKRDLALPEVACFLSHIDAWRQIGDGNSPAAFVFEDDVEIDDSISDLLSAISGREPDWDILKLFSDKPKPLTNPASLTSRYRYGTPHIIPMSTIAYAITRPAARELARKSLPLGRPVDLFIKHWWEHGSCVKLVQPSPASQQANHSLSSAIEPHRTPTGRQNRVARFVRNTLYQLLFRYRTWVYAARRPNSRRWIEANTHHRTVEDGMNA